MSSPQEGAPKVGEMLGKFTFYENQETAHLSSLVAEKELERLKRQVFEVNQGLIELGSPMVNLGANVVIELGVDGQLVMHCSSDFESTQGVVGVFNGLEIVDTRQLTIDEGILQSSRLQTYEVCLAIEPSAQDRSLEGRLNPVRKFVPLSKLEGPIYQGQ